MTYTGPGQAQRTSADWSNQPTGGTPEYGHTTYTDSALGLMSKADSTGTTSYTKDPGGLLISERTPGGAFYYVFDGQGNVVMLVDPPSGAPVVIVSTCPTGNQAGDGWQAPGTHIVDQNVWQHAGAFGAGTDIGDGNVKFGARYLSDTNGGGTQLASSTSLVASGGDGEVNSPTSLPGSNKPVTGTCETAYLQLD